MRDSGHRKKKSKYELHHHQLVEEKNVQIIYRIGLQITVLKVTSIDLAVLRCHGWPS